MGESGNPGALAAAGAPNTFNSPAERSGDNLARAVLQVPSGPSQEAIAACDDSVFDELARDFDLIESYAISGKEAARRREGAEVRLRLRIQLRDLFRYAVEMHDLLSPGASKESGS